MAAVICAAFVIYDGDQKRVLAARDGDGAQNMHWGVTDDGRFMFGSEVFDLKDCNPTATPFPAGLWPLLSTFMPLHALLHTPCEVKILEPTARAHAAVPMSDCVIPRHPCNASVLDMQGSGEYCFRSVPCARAGSLYVSEGELLACSPGDKVRCFPPPP